MPLITRAKDTNKDQTYFIWQIKQEQLPHILFPVGEYDVKAYVRSYAVSKGLITSSKPDSQGLCFVGQTSLREMLLQTLGRKDGFIYTYLTQVQIDKLGLTVHKKNKVLLSNSDKIKIKLGNHEGAFLFTIGQRQNLGLSNGPWFVAEVDIVNNEVIVCHNEYQEEIMSKTLIIKDLNWHLDVTQESAYTKSKEVKFSELSLEIQLKVKQFYTPKIIGDLFLRVFKLRLKAQIRYRSEAKNCDVFVLKPMHAFNINSVKDSIPNIYSTSIVEFDQSIKAAAKGQSIVFYDYDTDQYLIGGGVIEKVLQ
jgi:tRNA U34 2-thiouridine synthase MnmA/TrmU